MIKKSLIWKCSKEYFQDIINKSNSISECLSYFGLENKGSNYKTLRTRIEYDNVDATSLYERVKSNTQLRIKNLHKEKTKPLCDFLKENSKCNRNYLKKRLIKEGVLKNECCICMNKGIWNNKILSLQLNHINGISNDNRIENLEIICPNCHSQTSNFAGKNKRKIKEIADKKNRKSKISLVTKEELELLVKEKPFTHIGKQFGVTDNAIRKWCKIYDINTKPYRRGYWTKCKS